MCTVMQLLGQLLNDNDLTYHNRLQLLLGHPPLVWPQGSITSNQQR